jgi:hypothetical protein
MDEGFHLRHFRGPKPEVFFQCPNFESLEVALRDELHKSSQTLIPEETVVDFVFPATSTITVPPSHQPNLRGLGIQQIATPQVIPVATILCENVIGQDRLKIQRAIAKSFVELIQKIDGFRYMERQAWNKDHSDGTRFKYVCLDSLQNRDRLCNSKRYQELAKKRGTEDMGGVAGRSRLPTYDCGGAVHVKFSLERDQINVIYRHNSIHRDITTRQSTAHYVVLPAEYVNLKFSTNSFYPQACSYFLIFLHLKPIDQLRKERTLELYLV